MSTIAMVGEWRAMGRPSTFSVEIADEICLRLSEGVSLATICRDMDLGYSTVMAWLKVHADFQENYTRAREDQGDADADKVTDVAHRVLTGEIDPQAARVAIDAFKWSAGKRRPKVYGEKQQLEHSGPGGDPIKTVTRIELVAPGDGDNQA